jgi:hypothetical protein
MTRGDVSVIVAACGSVLLFQQCCDWLTLMQVMIDKAHDGTLSRGCWF